MNYLTNFMNAFNQTGQNGGQSNSQFDFAGKANPDDGSQHAQAGMPQFGGDAMQRMQDPIVGMPEEFGTEGMPPSLQQALGQNQGQIDQMVANTPQANFSGFTGPGVLPPLQPDQNPMQFDVAQQSYPVGGGSQTPQPSLGYTPMSQPANPQQQAGFNNMTSMLPTDPSSEQGFDPNIFLRLAEGYNRGGLVGALGMALTR